ncbi:hypothetical protein CFIMG_004577RA (mitochondrion) [Ceratocystis fimbriata CBS 114723]|jgi:hypothetical protein
MPEI